jgi:membrane associated rhomboid family serine protease
MFRSILDDVREMLQRGNMLTRLIVVNILLFVVIGVLIRYLLPGVYNGMIDYLALSSDIWWNIKHPWVFITHMFLHDGIYHIFWNMLLYYWFGSIIGDLIGDNKILSLYIYGGLTGVVLYLLSYYFILPPDMIGARALGASAAVMATVVAAGVLAPDYKVRLILIGTVSIKYIVIALLIMDMIGTTTNNNTGGHFAHLGGALFGWYFIYSLKNGNDLSIPFNRFLEKIRLLFDPEKRKRTNMKVSHKGGQQAVAPSKKPKRDQETQEKVDKILDKINEKGYDQLTKEEKEFLFWASKREK